MPVSARRLAQIRLDPAPDFGMLVARLRRLTGIETAFLAVTLNIKPSRLDAIAYGRPPTYDEGRMLLAALQRAGGTLDGLKPE